MATLTIADLDNGKRDLQTVDAVANSREDFTQSRYGDSVLTLAGALRRLGYQAPVPYDSGLNVDSALFTVSHDGVIYAPDPSLVPFTTGAWDAAQWRVVQNTANTNHVYQFPTLGDAQAAAATLPDGSAIEVEGHSRGHVESGIYVPTSDATPDTLENYAALDSYAGRASNIFLTEPDVSGLWVRTNSGKPVNGGTVREVNGSTWERQFMGRALASWWGVSSDASDNKAALQSAIDAAEFIEMPSGRIKLSPGVKLRDGTRIFGAGPSPVSPYDSSLHGRVGGTELYLISPGYALDASETLGAGVDGIAIKSNTGTISAYATAPGYAAGYFGINVTKSLQFSAKNWSAHGLEVAIYSGDIASGMPTSFADFDSWSANDCLRVFDLGPPSSTGYASRDIRIANEVLALHCGQYIRAYWPDGIRLEELRLFQATGYSVEIWKAPFVTLSAVTIFESSTSNLLLDGCDYVTGGAVILSRSGGYSTTTPWARAPAAIIRNCGTVALQGSIEHPGGAAFDVISTKAFTFNGSVDTAYFTSGDQSPTDPSGIFKLTKVDGSNINATVNGDGAWFSVTSDSESSLGANGSISGSRVLGQTRAWGIKGSAFNFKKKIDVPEMSAGSTQVIETFAINLPPGKKLVVRSWQMSAPVNATLVIGGKIFTDARVPEPEGGYSSSERYIIQDNSSGTGYIGVSFEVGLRNLSGGVLNVPPGHMANISLALEY